MFLQAMQSAFCRGVVLASGHLEERIQNYMGLGELEYEVGMWIELAPYLSSAG
jgi:hypothetical protein